MPPRRYHKSWAASLLLALALGVAPSSLLRTTAGAITTHAAAQSKEKIKPTTRNYNTDGGWRPSARGAAGAVAFGAFLSCSAPSTSGSSAAHARVLGALLASPHLAAARPFGPANASMTRRKLGYVMTDGNIKTAVTAWFDDATAAEATYGHISTWATGDVTDMSFLFCSGSWCSYYNSAASSFNEDISAWATSSVTTMYRMFRGASAFNNPIGDWSIGNVKNMELMFGYAGSFNQAIGDWSVGAVTTMNSMFEGATNFDQDLSDWSVDNVEDMTDMFRFAYAFDQDLGWCVNDGVSLYLAFSGTQCQSTACGVTWAAAVRCGGKGGILDDTSIRTAVSGWFYDVIAAEATHGHISTWETGDVTDMSSLYHMRSTRAKESF